MVRPGRKSANDFVVKYKEPSKRMRTPKHIHVIVDLFIKRERQKRLTNKLLEHLLDNVIPKLSPSHGFPPKLQVFQREHGRKYKKLDRYGEYTVEFLLVVIELLAIQELTNYPQGRMHVEGLRRMRDGKDIYTVVSGATFTGRR